MTDQQAEWDAIHQQHRWGKYPETDMLLTLSLFDWTEKPTVLDAGCGNGAVMRWAIKQGLTVYGIDYSPTAIENTRSFLESEGCKQPHLEVGNLLSLPYPDSTFGLVIDSFSVQHNSMEQVHDILREFKRVMRPNAVLYTSWTGKESEPSPPPAHLELTLVELADLIAEHFGIITADQSMRLMNLTGQRLVKNIVLACKKEGNG